MSIASQITTMQEHIEDIYDTFAVAGVDTSVAAKNIVNINANLKERLEYYLANGLDVVWNNWNKVSGSGTTLSLNNTIQAKMDFVYKGNTSQSILPSGYTQVDYITSDGNSYIDTGKTLRDNFKIETKFIHNQQSSNEQPIISTWATSYAWFNLYIASNNQLRFYAAGNHMTANPTLTIGNINTVSYSRNDNEWVGTLNGEEVTFTTELTSSNPTTFKILSRGDGTRGSYVSIYRLKLFENNILTMDLIPCYRNNDNVIGMYDIVNNIFYTNSGTGNFTYGSVAPTPECPIPVNVVTGDNEVKVEGKNLLNDYDLINRYKIASIEGNLLTSNAISSNYDTFQPMTRSQKISLIENSNYYVSFDCRLKSGTYEGRIGRATILNTSGGTLTINDTPILNPKISSNFQRMCFKSTANTSTSERIAIMLQVQENLNSAVFEIKNIMIATSSDTTYVPYQSQTYPINLGVKNLIDLINFAPISNNTVVSLIDNGINVNNTSSGYGAKIQLTDLKANTDYYISYNWKNISNGANRVVVFAGTGTSATLASFNNLNGGTFNTGDNTTINIWFYAAVPGIAEVEYTNIQLEEGTVKHSYTPSWFESMELCKIGDYQDYIAKSTGKNLFSGWTKGKSLNPTNGAERNDESGVYGAVSDYIPVNLTTHTNYYLSGLSDTISSFIGAYNSSKQFLGRTAGSNRKNIGLTSNSFTSGTPQGTGDIAYLRITQYTSTSASDVNVVDTLQTQLEIGNDASSYEPYGTGWYKYGTIGKAIVDGGEDWGADEQGGYNNYKIILNDALGGDTIITCLSNYFKSVTGNQSWSGNIDNAIGIGSSKTLRFRRTTFATTNDFKTWLTTHNTTVYYVLNTPIVTEITDTTLLNQLEAIKLSYNEQTNISQTNADKPFILDVTALKDLDAEDTTPALTTNQGLLFTQPPVSENFINDEDDNSILEETINEEEPNIEDDNREEEEPVDFFEKEIINNDEEQEEIPTEPIEIDNGQR